MKKKKKCLNIAKKKLNNNNNNKNGSYNPILPLNQSTIFICDILQEKHSVFLFPPTTLTLETEILEETTSNKIVKCLPRTFISRKKIKTTCGVHSFRTFT
jgi:hypothetical protein